MSTTDDGLPILDSVAALARMLVSNEDLADGTITQVEYDRQNRRFVASTGQEYADALAAIAQVEHWSPADMGRQARAGLAALTALDARIRYVVTGPTTVIYTVSVADEQGTIVFSEQADADGPPSRHAARSALLDVADSVRGGLL